MSTEIWQLFMVIVLGLIFGSFASVLTYRIPNNQSILRPNSRCPHCRKGIAIKDNIPILSYLILKGKCRNCDNRIGLKYPFIECFTAILFIISYLRLGLSIPTFSLFALATVTWPLVITDIKFRRLPNKLTVSAFFLGLTFSLVNAFLERSWVLFKFSILYSISSFIFFLFLNFASRGGMGFGDMKLGAMIGSLLFFLPWTDYVAIYFVAFGSGSIFGVLLMVLKKANRKSRIAFGPFILAGTWFILIKELIS